MVTEPFNIKNVYADPVDLWFVAQAMIRRSALVAKHNGIARIRAFPFTYMANNFHVANGF